MISIKFATILLLICCWFFNNVPLVRCSPAIKNRQKPPTIITSSTSSKNNLTGEYAEGNVAAFADKGWQQYMQDRHVIKKNIERGFSLFAIFDGHGDDFAAEYAKNKLIEILENIIGEIKQYIKEKKYGSTNVVVEKYEKYIDQNDNNINIDYEKLLDEKILEFDKLLIAELNKINNKSGTTATIALIDEEEKKLWVANVGDSRAVMCDSKGNAVALSVDHNLRRDEERSRIVAAGGTVVPAKDGGILRINGSLAVSRTLGDPGDMKENNLLIAKPYIANVDLSTDRPMFLILASDGLWDVFTNEEAVAFVQEKFEYSSQISLNIAASIGNAALEKKSTDNITVIVIKLSEA